MGTIFVLAAVIASISLYDFYTTRSWQQVTSSIRNETVFQNRNKAYGAYVMRRDYGKTVMYSFAALALLTGVAFTALGRNKENNSKTVIEDTEFKTISYNIEIEKAPEIKKEVVQKAVQPTQTEKFVEPIVVDKKVETTLEPIKGDVPVGTTTSTGTNDGFGTITDGKGTATGIAEPVKPEPVDDPLYPAKMAEFPGGLPALKKYFLDELNMPQIAIELGIKGKCYLQFIVDKEGQISEISMQRGIAECPECDKEAIRVIKKMPKWIPARNERNKPMRSIFNIPIGFDATH